MEHPEPSPALSEPHLAAALRQTQALYRVTSAIIEHTDLASLLQTVVDAVSHALPAERVVLITFDMARRELQHFVKGGPGQDSVVHVGYDELEHGLSGWVLHHQCPALSPRSPRDPRESPEVQVRREQTQCGDIIVVPLLYRGLILGTLTAINHYEGATFGQPQVDIMMAMASHCAVALTTAEYHDRLEKEIAQRRALQDALAQARDAALDASRLKSEFLANMSHEIRTPMNAVLGLLRVLQGTTLTARQRDYVSKARSAAQTLLGLLNDILDFSKVEAGKISLEPHAQPMEAFLRDLAAVMGAGVDSARTVELIFDIDENLPAVLQIDALRLRQVLTNLCNNALKFTAAGEVVLEIRCLARTEDLVKLRFAVRDSGIGIAPEHQQHIFDAFTQAEGSTTRRYGGTGLGLTICKRLVALMGGELRVQSTPGVGSCFEFTLTLPALPTPAPAGPVPSTTTTPLRVLLVHPHALSRTLAVQALQAHGIAAHALSEPDAIAPALKALGGVDVAVVTPSNQEPTFMALAQLGQRPATVLITAQGSATPLAEMPSGFLLLQPYTPAMLREAVNEALHGPSSAHLVGDAAAALPLAGMRLLVVDDNAINQHIAQELLQSRGAVVSLASNGQEGVDAVLQGAFDAVLMDVQMPVMDGYQATQAIRAHRRFATLPIIAMTANALRRDRDACLQAGMNDHVGKPFELDALIFTLCTHTGRSVAQGAPASSDRRATAGAAIDLSGALARLGGNEILFARSVRAFARELESAIAPLNIGAQCDQRQESARIAHTLKGTALTLGATDLANAAAQYEQAVQTKAEPLRPEDSPLQALLHAMEAARSALLASMRQEPGHMAYDVAPEPQPDSPETSITALRAALECLQTQAEAGDLQVLEHYAQVGAMLRQTDAARCADLDHALQELNLENAARTCAKWRQALGTKA